MEIGASNFEDLFDFSPELLEPTSPPQGQGQGQGFPQDSYIPLVLQNKINIVNERNKLSQSVPNSWGGINILPNSVAKNRPSSSVGAKGDEETFNTSVGQLLEDLPTPESGTSPSVTVVKGKRGRKPGQKNLRTDMKSKLERSRQSARECRARKKLRYQYLDDLILEREKANIKLRDELVKYQLWCHELDKGIIPDGLLDAVKEFKQEEASLKL